MKKLSGYEIQYSFQTGKSSKIDCGSGVFIYTPAYVTWLERKIQNIERAKVDSGVAALDGDYATVTSRTANGSETTTPVDGALPPKPYEKIFETLKREKYAEISTIDAFNFMRWMESKSLYVRVDFSVNEKPGITSMKLN